MSYLRVVDWQFSFLQVWDWQEERWFMVASHLRFTSLNIRFEFAATHWTWMQKYCFYSPQTLNTYIWFPELLCPMTKEDTQGGQGEIGLCYVLLKCTIANHHVLYFFDIEKSVFDSDYQPKGGKQSADHSSWTFGKLHRISFRWDGVNFTGNSSSWVCKFTFSKLYQNV